MRGIVSGSSSNNGIDYHIQPNWDSAEATTDQSIDLTPTGFTLQTSDGNYNGGGASYVYMCLRRSDGYVGKPPELGTDVFAIEDAGLYPTVPCFHSGFPVDFGIRRRKDMAETWITSARLMGESKSLKTDGTPGESNDTNGVFDSNTGYYSGLNQYTNAWMWKRHAGFDVVTYKGLSGANGQKIPHSLGKPAEMIWIKRRDGSEEWAVGADGMTDWNKYMKLNATDAEANAYGTFSSTAPTATHFSLSQSSRANYTGYEYIAMLFASVDGISKVGSYTGTDGSTITITTGFPPRFIVVKKTDGAGSWHVFDTVRGMGSGNDPVLMLNNNNAQVAVDYINPTSTGWQTVGGNLAQGNFIYYAHA